MTAQPKPRLYELERRELVADLEPAPRALYGCDECGARFAGGTAVDLWIAHTTPRCKDVEAGERLQAEIAASLARKRKVEDALVDPFLTAVEELGYVAAIEAIARLVEGCGDRDKPNADTWEHRSLILHTAANYGEEL
jgi:hypothetical protein